MHARENSSSFCGVFMLGPAGDSQQIQHVWSHWLQYQYISMFTKPHIEHFYPPWGHFSLCNIFSQAFLFNLLWAFVDAYHFGLASVSGFSLERTKNWEGFSFAAIAIPSLHRHKLSGISLSEVLPSLQGGRRALQKIPDGTSGLCVLCLKKSAWDDITRTQVSNAGVSGEKNKEQPGTICIYKYETYTVHAAAALHKQV